jgi:hypothetical protein
VVHVEKIDGLGSTRFAAGSGKAFLVDEDIEERGLAHVGPAGKGDFGPVRSRILIFTKCTLDEGDVHLPGSESSHRE